MDRAGRDKLRARADWRAARVDRDRGTGAVVVGAIAQQILARSEFGLAVVRMLG